MTVQLENPTAQRFNSISWHDSKLTGLCFYKAGEEEKVAKRFDSTAGRDPLSAIRKILLDYIAYAEENPFEYRILFMSIETLGELELTREDLQERNPAFGSCYAHPNRNCFRFLRDVL
ncbi:hypothetical protein [Terriglobus tenax]|uniref:hypothetical protein n=1 Tax=Terriglobus tenax TaxID=1111115 RepID=UPI0021E0B58C|nr:hypothetical protein [Terriglobus tenax]